MMRKRRIAALLGAVALAACFSASLAGTAHAADPVVPSSTWNEIFAPFDNGRGNTMCVDAPGGTSQVGASLQFYHCHGYASNGAPQRWHFITLNVTIIQNGVAVYNGPVYKIQNVGNGLCIGFTGFFASANARLIQTTCDEGIEWRLNPQNDNGTNPLFDLSPILSDSICMATGDLSDNNQTPLMSRFCDGFQDAAQILELG
jgi:hypothetical protein